MNKFEKFPLMVSVLTETNFLYDYIMSDKPPVEKLKYLDSEELGFLSDKLLSLHNITISAMKYKLEMEKKREEFTLKVGTIVTCTEPKLVGQDLEVIKEPRLRAMGRVLVMVRPIGSTRTYKVPIEMIIFPNGEHCPKLQYTCSKYDYMGFKWSDYFPQEFLDRDNYFSHEKN